MPPSGSARHPVRKSRQSRPPTIKFRSRCIRMDYSCHYSVSMRTGKSATDLIKDVLTSSHPTPRGTPPNANELTVTELLQRVDSDQFLRSVLQAGQSLLSNSAADGSTPPASDSEFSPVAMGAYQRRDGMDLDPPTTQINTPGLQAGPDATAQPHSRSDVMSMHDNIYMSVGDMGFPAVESGVQGFPLSAQPIDLDYFAPLEFFEPEPPQTSEMAGASSTNGITVGAIPQQPPAGMPGHSCLRSAKALQKAVIALANKDETTQGECGIFHTTTLRTPIDQALLVCSSISRQLLEILQCRCESDAHLPFLVAVLISKVLATYSTIAKIDDSAPFDVATPRIRKEQEQDQQQQQQQQHRHEDAFVAVPLQLGSYNVDKDIEGTLRAQLVLYEVSKLSSFAQLFGQKYCGYGGNAKPNDERPIYPALMQFIEDRHERTREACELRITLSLRKTQLHGDRGLS
ncbi:hypothetical protein F5B21DRAFT_516040 [Xylaria acuta]|nr:hypothetical protein F5B21DRAFT_516040 [Xylaria acuta]